MKSKIGWILAGVLALILLLALALPGYFGFGRGWAGHWGMMGNYGGMMGPGFRAFPFGGLMMLPALLIPLGILILLVVGGVWLVNSLSRGSGSSVGPAPAAPAAPARACSNCGKPTQVDWTVCPYCGTALG